MQAFFVNSSNVEDFRDAFKMLDKQAKTLMILSCDQNNYDNSILSDIFVQAKSVVMGGIFPQIIYQNKNYETGAIIASIDDVVDISIIKNISSNNNIDQDIEDNIELSLGETKTIFVFVDGLSKNIGNVISGLFDNFGLYANYIGGGAGSLSFVPKPVIFTNEGVLEDCVVIATSKLQSAIGVKHGWQIITDPMKVTKSEKNIVMELDYRLAFETYRRVVEADSGRTFDDTNFFDIAKGYPLGISKLSGEVIVRDPIMSKNGHLICVGDVNENVFVSILKGENHNLIESAKKANVEAKQSATFESFTFFIDCISRVLFLGDEFQNEILQVLDDGNITIGALTLGEIANNKKHYLEFYNKTAVVAKIETK